MTESVCGEFVGTCISMPGFTATNVCTYTKPTCPFKMGVKETASVGVPVAKSFPSVSCGDTKCALCMDLAVLFVMMSTFGACLSGYNHSQVETE